MSRPYSGEPFVLPIIAFPVALFLLPATVAAQASTSMLETAGGPLGWRMVALHVGRAPQ